MCYCFLLLQMGNVGQGGWTAENIVVRIRPAADNDTNLSQNLNVGVYDEPI